jgi:hypothetical protein
VGRVKKVMEMFAGGAFFVVLIIVNTVTYMLIDGWFEGSIAGLKDDE